MCSVMIVKSFILLDIDKGLMQKYFAQSRRSKRFMYFYKQNLDDSETVCCITLNYFVLLQDLIFFSHYLQN